MSTDRFDFVKLDNISNKAQRFNQGKLRWDLVYWEGVEEMLKVLEAGAIKYTPDNWKQGLNREEILESLQRHLVALFKGEEIDPDPTMMKSHHMGNIMCNAMFYLYFYHTGTFKEDRNNPFKKPSIELTVSNSSETN